MHRATTTFVIVGMQGLAATAAATIDNSGSLGLDRGLFFTANGRVRLQG